MTPNFEHISTLKSNSIVQVNDALIVLKHFTELNFKLLPALDGLLGKATTSEQEKEQIDSIMAEIESFKLNKKASEVLMNSPVLELIKAAYKAIVDVENPHSKAKKMVEFKNEYFRLQANWKLIASN